jgi:hypothetical protein
LLLAEDIQVIWHTGKTHYENYKHFENDQCRVHDFIYEMKIGFKLEWNILMELKLSFLNNESFCYLSSAILDDDSFKCIDVNICLFEDILFLSSFIILRF